MKLCSLLFMGFALCLAGSSACDGTRSVEVDTGEDAPREGSTRASLRDDLGRDLPPKADASTRESAGQPSRFETRIGPQPWPEDLPSRWPRPTEARVVADTRQQRGDRLLLVDLPDFPGEALDSYRDALRGRGYDVVDAPQTPRASHVLHAIREGDEAVLTFLGRKQGTRLEILFIGQASG